MTQTSNTESVAMSHLKHLNGDPLGTSIALVGPWVVWEATVTAVPQPPPNHMSDWSVGSLMM